MSSLSALASRHLLSTAAGGRLAVSAFAVTFLLFAAGTAFAHEVKAGALELHHPWARATAPSAPVAGGFMVIKNTGTEADRLVGGSATVSESVQIHEMEVVDGVMKMKEVAGGLEIPAGGEVVLKPGSYHVMFMGLKQQLKEGETFAGTLTFEKAGAVEVEYLVEGLAAKEPSHDGMSQ